MKHLISICVAVIFLLTAVGCEEKKGDASVTAEDSLYVSIPDTAIYGVVGEGTTMHVLELLAEDGRTLTFAVNQDSCSDVQGGVFSGDKVTLTVREGSDGPEVVKLVNITSLFGKWTSIDRNFEIMQDGVVSGAVKTESNPYTQWSMANANLILNADTFDVLLLGPDSMTIENAKGIFVYKRQK